MEQPAFTKYPPQQSYSDPAKLFAELLPAVPRVVLQACHSLGYRPSQMDFEDLVQEVILLLINDDYYNLRSFNHLSSPQTWLFAVVKHHLGRKIQRQKREENLKALLPDSRSFQPEQENKLIDQERAELLSVALSELTGRQQRLFRLLCRDEMSRSEVAREMGIKTESVYRERVVVIRNARKSGPG